METVQSMLIKMKTMGRVNQKFFLISLVLLASKVAWAISPKVDDVLRNTLERDGHANILVSMRAGTQDILDDLATRTFSSRTERSQAVYDALTTRARDSQKRILDLLSSQSVVKNFKFGTVQSLWITNQVAVQVASEKIVVLLDSMDEISRIQEDEIVYIDTPLENVPQVNQWGIEKIQAPAAWLQFGGTTGSGIVIGNIDTGVRHTHTILRGSYKNDDHSWYDPYNTTRTPADFHGHGSHTVGTIAGQNGYGVAPGAKWIACKGLYDNGSGAGANLLACGQFMVCPTTYNGANADCSKTPHIVSNSWGSSIGGITYYDGMIAAWHSAGVIPVFSAGNNGPNCATATSPGDRDVIGVGSTTSTDQRSSFSSAGPSVDSKLKPDISAPGSSITSAGHTTDDAYTIMSGTSMACPHVAGAIALLLNRNANLSYAQIKSLLQSHADRNLSFSNTACGNVYDNAFPNNHFGYGRLNINRSLQAVG